MPQFKNGDIFLHLSPGDTLLVTTNAMIKKDGRLVMGAGFAKQVRDRWLNADLHLAQSVKWLGSYYGITSGALVGQWNKRHIRIMGFQTKISPWEESSIKLIKNSVDRLMEYVKLYPYGTYHLPYPGIGYGGLSPEQLQDALDALPNRVCIYQYPTSFLGEAL